MTKIPLIFLALAFTLHAEDAPKPPTAEELTAQMAEQKQENERLTKLLNAYVSKNYKCDQELTILQTLGPQTQSKPQVQRPVKPSAQKSATPSEPKVK